MRVSSVSFLVFQISAILFAPSIDNALLYSLTRFNPNESKYYKPLSITKYEVKSRVPIQKNYLSGPYPRKFPVMAGLTIYINILLRSNTCLKCKGRLHF